eukprot:1484010-Lingulodinium_polyedra.AAC.1
MDQSGPTRIQQTPPAAVPSPQALPAAQADASSGQALPGQNPQVQPQQPQPAAETSMQAQPTEQPNTSLGQALPGQ